MPRRWTQDETEARAASAATAVPGHAVLWAWGWWLAAFAGGVLAVVTALLSVLTAGEPAAPGANTVLVSDAEKAALQAYSDGLVRLARGDVEAASQRFDEASIAVSPSLAAAAVDAATRVRYLRSVPTAMRPAAVSFVRLPAVLRWTITTVLACVAAVAVRRGLALNLRPGCEIGPFPSLPARDAQAEDAFRRALLAEINHIALRYQATAIAGRAGPLIVGGTFLPPDEKGGAAAETLAAVSEFVARGVVAVPLEQVTRLMALFRRQAVYRVAGRLIVGDNEVRGVAEIRNVAAGVVVARPAVSSVDHRLISRPGPAPRAAGMLGHRHEIVAELLASQVWLALAEGARPQTQPGSWRTVTHFVRALEALADYDAAPEAAEALARARTELLSVRASEPTYRPARFTLGYVELLRGEHGACISTMEAFLADTERNVAAFAKQLADRWVARPPRYWALKPLLRIEARLSGQGRLRQWLARPLQRAHETFDWWADIFFEMHGGTLFRAARAWAAHGSEMKFLDEFRRTEPDAAEALLSTHLRQFEAYPELRELVECVIGRAVGKRPPNEARELLDGLLDEQVVADLDRALELLDFQLMSASIVRSLTHSGLDDQAEAAGQVDEALTKVPENLAAVYLKPGLERITSQAAAGRFDDARHALRALRQHTREPSEHAAVHSLIHERPPEPSRRWVAFLFPALGDLVRQTDIVVNDSFYLEARYYRALARYQQLTLDSLIQVVEEQDDLLLRRYFLSDPYRTAAGRRRAPGNGGGQAERLGELIGLLRCLWISASCRLLLANARPTLGRDGIGPVVFPDHGYEAHGEAQTRLAGSVASARWDLSRWLDEHKDDLARWRHVARSPRLRAAAAGALALLVRYDRSCSRDGPRLTLPEELPHALELAEEAASARPTAHGWTELAEMLAAEARRDEAIALLRNAVRVAPGHKVARSWLRLLDQ